VQAIHPLVVPPDPALAWRRTDRQSSNAFPFVRVSVEVALLFFIAEMRILSMAVKYGRNVLFCRPNRTERIPLVSVLVLPCLRMRHAAASSSRGEPGILPTFFLATLVQGHRQGAGRNSIGLLGSVYRRGTVQLRPPPMALGSPLTDRKVSAAATAMPLAKGLTTPPPGPAAFLGTSVDEGPMGTHCTGPNTSAAWLAGGGEVALGAVTAVASLGSRLAAEFMGRSMSFAADPS
jgi:hypothetical protein